MVRMRGFPKLRTLEGTAGAVSLGYRTILELRTAGSTDLEQLASEAFFSWMRAKRLHPELVSDLPKSVGPGAIASKSSGETPAGALATRFRLSELGNNGVWTTTLTVGITARGSQWFWLDVDTDTIDASDPEVTRWVATPRLARNLLSSLDAWDGVVSMRDRSIKVTVDQAPMLLEQLLNPSRRHPILIAAIPDGVSVSRWTGFVDQFTKETAGLAATFVVDVGARDWLNEQLGPVYSVGQGTIRTFLDHLDIGNQSESRRHRFLSSARLVRGIDNPRDVIRAVGWAIRRGAVELAVPEYARDAQRLFATEQIKNRGRAGLPPIELSTAGPKSLSATGSGMLGSRGEMQLASIAEAVFGTAELDDEKFDSLIKLAVGAAEAESIMTEFLVAIDELEQRVQVGEQLLAEEIRRSQDRELELAEMQDEAHRDGEERRRLQRLLRRTSAEAEIWASDSDTEPERSPTDMTELITWVDDFTYVEFTGDIRNALALEEHDVIGRWASTIWEQLCALEDYAKAKRNNDFTGSLYEYLNRPPLGYRTFAAGKYAPTESDTVINNSRMQSARIFPVPSSVSSTEQTLYTAHTRVARYGMISPRMYLLDDTSASGKVFIGYIGRHLEISGSN